MINWVIERDVFNTKQFDEMCDQVRVRGDNLSVVRIIPFVHEIEGKVPQLTGPTVCYGSIGIQKVANQHNWVPGVFSGDFSTVAYRALGDRFLNNDSHVISMPDLEMACHYGDNGYTQPFFCKPNDDNKEFAGQIFTPREFVDWYWKMQEIGYIKDVCFDVITAPVRELAVEYRCLVVGDSVPEISIYRQWQSVMPERGYYPDVIDFVHDCNRIWRPANVFIIDVAQTREGLRVVEYNTFNSAGFYAMDARRVVNAVSEFVEKNHGTTEQ